MDRAGGTAHDPGSTSHPLPHPAAPERATNESPHLAIVDADGTVRGIGEQAKETLRARPGRYRLLLALSGLMVLSQEAETGQAQGGEQVLLAGEITTASTLIEVLNMIAAQHWRGQLQIFTHDSHRVLLLDEGVLKFASTNDPADRLDRVVQDLGYLTPSQVAGVVVGESDGRRFGQLLVDRGLLSHDQLFECLQAQMQQIFFSTLMVTEGRYLFSVPEADAPPPPVTVHLPIPSMLLDGVCRIDEMSLFRQRIPSSAARPVARDSDAPPPADTTAREVLALCDGNHTIQAIARRVGCDEFECTKLVYQLLEKGSVALRSTGDIDEPSVRQLVARFDLVFRDLFAAAADGGDPARSREIVALWLQSSGYLRFVGDRLLEDGSIDAETLLAVLRRERIRDAVDFASQMLHELAAFTLFAVTSFMPRERESELMRVAARHLGGGFA